MASSRIPNFRQGARDFLFGLRRPNNSGVELNTQSSSDNDGGALGFNSSKSSSSSISSSNSNNNSGVELNTQSRGDRWLSEGIKTPIFVVGFLFNVQRYVVSLS